MTLLKELVGMLNHLRMSERQRYCKMFATVSWVSGVYRVLKEFIVSWIWCQGYQVHFGPKHSAYPCSSPGWGRGFGRIPGSAAQRPLSSDYQVKLFHLKNTVFIIIIIIVIPMIKITLLSLTLKVLIVCYFPINYCFHFKCANF